VNHITFITPKELAKEPRKDRMNLPIKQHYESIHQDRSTLSHWRITNHCHKYLRGSKFLIDFDSQLLTSNAFLIINNPEIIVINNPVKMYSEGNPTQYWSGPTKGIMKIGLFQQWSMNQ
jgi:hypothetical protein